MNTHKIAQALNSLLLALGELSEALEQPEGDERAQARAATVPAGTPSPTDLPPSFEELPPDDWADPLAAKIEAIPERIGGDGGVCPDHGLAWDVVPGGISKRTGKKYTAFWHCPSFNCKQKPERDWQDAHPAAAA
jgi:hypothetical protein